MRYWSGASPRELHEKTLYCERVTVWCALSRAAIIGPSFLYVEEHTVTMNAVCYREIIEAFFLPKLEEIELGDVLRFSTTEPRHTQPEVLREHFHDGLDC